MRFDRLEAFRILDVMLFEHSLGVGDSFSRCKRWCDGFRFKYNKSDFGRAVSVDFG
jgi:hypothetical protein